MSWTCSTFLFNPVLEIALDEFIEAYGKICPHVSNLKQYYLDNVKGKIAESDTIMKYVQHDFKNKERRKCLESGSDRLFMDKKMYESCQFIRHMQLRPLWKHKGEGALTQQDKDEIWKMLRRLWLLAQATLTLPAEVCEKMEKLAMDRAQSFNMMQPSAEFDVKEVAEECKEIIHRVKGPHFSQILNWGQEMAMSPYSPLIQLLPDKYTRYGERLQTMIQDPEYRELIVETIAPVFNSVRSGAEKQGINLIEEGDEEDDNNDEKKRNDEEEEEEEYDFENPDYSDLELAPGATESDKEKVNWIVDAIFAILTKHGGDLKEAVLHPEKLAEVFTNIGNLKKITTTITKDIEEVSKTIKKVERSATSSKKMLKAQ